MGTSAPSRGLAGDHRDRNTHALLALTHGSLRSGECPQPVGRMAPYSDPSQMGKAGLARRVVAHTCYFHAAHP